MMSQKVIHLSHRLLRYLVIHSSLNSDPQEVKMTLSLTWRTLISSLPTDTFNLTCRYQHQESTVLVKDIENSLLSQEHGQCGLTVKIAIKILDRVVCRLTVFIHLLLFKPQLTENSSVFTLETLTLPLQSSDTTQTVEPMEILDQSSAISPPVETLRSLSSPRAMLSKSLLNITT